jgi:hypothetical protein
MIDKVRCMNTKVLISHSICFVLINLILVPCQSSFQAEIEPSPHELEPVDSIFGDTAPPARVQHAMAYDENREVIVLFGGGGDEGHPLNDIWEYDGSAWRRVQTDLSPAGRSLHAMVYHPGRKTTILFGGRTENEDETNDLWEYDGETWQQLENPPELGPRVGAAMAYDASRQTIVLFGGGDFRGPKWDTWQFNGDVWTRLDVEPPTIGSGAVGPKMAYDSARQVAVLLGLQGETFEFDGLSWKRILSWEDDSSSNEWIISLGVDLAYDSQRGVTVAFVGYNRDADPKTWEYDGNSWSQAVPLNSPSRRWYYAMAYDENRQVTVLFGGGNEDAHFNDTWEYDGVTWAQR